MLAAYRARKRFVLHRKCALIHDKHLSCERLKAHFKQAKPKALQSHSNLFFAYQPTVIYESFFSFKDTVHTDTAYKCPFAKTTVTDTF